MLLVVVCPSFVDLKDRFETLEGQVYLVQLSFTLNCMNGHAYSLGHSMKQVIEPSIFLICTFFWFYNL